ncbi:MAG: hypothetical protein N4A43_03405 [Alphaproteobacteria bacterium]|jgi:hypothetical protein|nr:hypothetical protein [Alphaproteobacteria bacterium]
MIAVVIYGIIAIALAAVAGYSIISFFDASRTMSRASENLSRMNMAVSLVKANVRYVDGEALVPMGSAGADYTILPTWMGAHDTSTSGDKYLYCPFATANNPSATSGTVTDGDSSTYTVAIKNNSQTGSRDYVYGFDDTFMDASVRNKGVLAFVISPLEGNSNLPKCSDVNYNANGNFVVPNGIVEVVQLGTVFSHRNLQASAKAVFYVDDVATGDASGRDSNNAATIDEAMSFMALHAPRVMEVRVAPGNYNITVNSFIDEAESLGESKVILIGDNGGNSSNINITTSTGSLSLPFNLHVKDVSISSDVFVSAGKSMFVDGTVGVESISLYGGKLYLDDENTVLNITGENSINAGIYASYGSMLVSLARNNGSKNYIHFTGSPTSGIYLKGNANFVYTDIDFTNAPTYGVFMSHGSYLNMDDTGLAKSLQKPSTSIFDNGWARGASGNSNTIVKGDSCWNVSANSLFEFSNNSTSVPQVPTMPDWDSNPANSTVNNYLEYSALKYVNESEWGCSP